MADLAPDDVPPAEVTLAERLQINPEPLQIVPTEHRWLSGLRSVTPEMQRQAWIALGGDPAIWDAEHPGHG